MKQVILLIFLLYLSTLIHEAQGRHLKKGHKLQEKTNLIGSSKGVIGEVSTLCKDGHCSSFTTKGRLTKVAKKSHHWLPNIHEDYYGPRGHRPRHH
uniref:Uncharacterized protein n=1 Tax=Solanum lycopersicum TaxID=4081 RepID=A0A3Q7J4L6_SOLLC